MLVGLGIRTDDIGGLLLQRREACFLTASLVEGRTGTAHALANLRELRHLHGAVSRSYKHRRQHFVVTASRTSNGLSLWKRCLRDIRDCPSLQRRTLP